jgi:hypothetical protein
LIAFPTFWEEEVLRTGPLRINVLVRPKGDASVAFDLGDFIVVLEDGRSLSPDDAARWVAVSSEAEPVGPVTLFGGQAWRGSLQYDVPLMDLAPFTLRPGTLSVNGEPLQLPPISFVKGHVYWSS